MRSSSSDISETQLVPTEYTAPRPRAHSLLSTSDSVDVDVLDDRDVLPVEGEQAVGGEGRLHLLLVVLVERVEEVLDDLALLAAAVAAELPGDDLRLLDHALAQQNKDQPHDAAACARFVAGLLLL